MSAGTLQGAYRKPTKAQLKEVDRREHAHLRQLALDHAVKLHSAAISLPVGIIESADRLYQFIATGKVIGLSATAKRRRKK